MAKLLTILLIIALVLCSSTITYAARPNPASHHQGKLEGEPKEVAEDDMNESCEGLNEEQCLMRRTLVAHTDYIYTQNLGP